MNERGRGREQERGREHERGGVRERERERGEEEREGERERESKRERRREREKASEKARKKLYHGVDKIQNVKWECLQNQGVGRCGSGIGRDEHKIRTRQRWLVGLTSRCSRVQERERGQVPSEQRTLLCISEEYW